METSILSEVEEIAAVNVVQELWRDVLCTSLTPTSTIRHYDASVMAPQIVEPAAYAVICGIGEPTTETARYSLLQHLGSDKGIDRYAAIQVPFGRIIELRLVDLGAEDGLRARDEFVLETHVAGRLAHPNILPVYEFGTDQLGRMYTCHPSTPGRTWNHILAERGLEENLRILLRVMDAVAFAHSKGFIHRDLKPGNIHIGLYGEVVVTGWGSACEVKRLQKADAPTRAHLAGTPAYMAPETALGFREQIGFRTDQYQLGAILYEIIMETAPHDAETLLESLVHAAENPLPVDVEPSPLLSIAVRAMHFPPPSRFASVAEFQKAIRAYLSHLESVRITELADQHYANASDQKSLGDYATALVLYEEGLNLWRENDAIASQIARTRIEYAVCALEEGDIARAESALPPSANVPAQKWPEYERACNRIQRARRHRTRRRWSALLLFVVLLVAARLAYVHWSHERHWREVYSMDFTRADSDLTGLLFTDAWQNKIVQPPPLQGGLALHDAQWCWLRDVKLPADARLVLRFSTHSAPDTLELALNAKREAVHRSHFQPAGQGLKLIVSDEDSRVTHKASPVPAPLFTGDYGLSISTNETQEIEFINRGGRIQVLLNGTVIHDSLSILPLEGEGLDMIGFRFWQSSTRILSLRVYEPRRSETPDFLMAGDRLVALGYREKAIDEYLRVAERHPGTRDAENALFKAFELMAEPQFLYSHGYLRQTAKTDLRRQFPHSLFNRHVMEKEILIDFEMGRYDVAIHRVRDLQREYPYANIVEKLWAQRPPSLPLEVRDTLFSLVSSPRPFVAIDGLAYTSLPETALSFKLLRAQNNLLSDFSGIRRLKGTTDINLSNNRLERIDTTAIPNLSHLNLGANRIRDIDFLRGGLPSLETLNLSNNRIHDLAPFDAPELKTLRVINLDGNAIEDMTPLQKTAPLSLSISSNRIRSLSPLPLERLLFLRADNNQIRQMPSFAGKRLNRISLTGNQIRDLSPLQAVSIRELSLTDNHVSSLAPLENIPVHNLFLRGNPIQDTDVEILANLPLLHLDISKTGIRDMNVILGLPGLELLRLDDTQFASMEIPKEGKLFWIQSTGGAIRSLEPLRTWDKSLKYTYPHLDAQNIGTAASAENQDVYLFLTSNEIASLDPLEGTPIHHLSIEDNKISSLVPLEGMPLKSLHAYGNRIESLAPIRGAPMHYLDLRANRIQSVESLSDSTALSFLALGENDIVDTTALANLHSLRWLDLSRNEIFDMHALQRLPLYGLDVSHNDIEFLPPSISMPLAYLDVRSNRIRSLTGLERRGIVELRCADNRISSLDPVIQMPLVSLDCANNPIVNMNILARVETLRHLRCDARQLALFSDITATSLEELRVVPGGTIREVGRLADLSTLRHLEMQSQAITDLAPLSGIPFDYLDVSDNPILSLAPFETSPPPTFLFESATLPEKELRRMRDLWAGQKETERHARTADVLLAARADDIDALRSMATPYEDRLYLHVPISKTWAEAKEMAESWGGQLAVLSRHDRNAVVAGMLALTDRAWIGLRTQDGHPAWVNGERVSANHRERLSPTLERIISFFTHYDNTIRYAIGRTGERWIDGYGDWYASDAPDERCAFIVEWNADVRSEVDVDMDEEADGRADVDVDVDMDVDMDGEVEVEAEVKK